MYRTLIEYIYIYRLFEMGFGEQVSEIVRRLPESRQTVLFSATLPKLLVEFTKAGLHDPSLIRWVYNFDKLFTLIFNLNLFVSGWMLIQSYLKC